jgi:hypothetical protein
MRRWLRRANIVFCVLFAAFLTLLTVSTAALLIENTGPVSARAHTMDDDALWMGHSWVNGQDGPAALTALEARLKGSGIRYLFVHAGPLSADGSLNAALDPKARWLTTALHSAIRSGALPHVVVEAWLGDIVGGGGLDLNSTATRDRIAGSVRQVFGYGFDGVHLDLEPVGTGDPGYLALLGQVHQLTRQAGKQLSVSVPPVELAGGLHSVTPGLWWTSAYLRSVADRVDQVAIMTYDISMAPTSGVYSGYVHRETEVALRAVPADVTLLIGVPAYQTTGVWLISGSENVAAGIRGVRLAISPDPPDRPLGVALYVDFTATAQDWASYQQDWVK